MLNDGTTDRKNQGFLFNDNDESFATPQYSFKRAAVHVQTVDLMLIREVMETQQVLLV